LQKQQAQRAGVPIVCLTTSFLPYLRFCPSDYLNVATINCKERLIKPEGRTLNMRKTIIAVIIILLIAAATVYFWHNRPPEGYGECSGEPDYSACVERARLLKECSEQYDPTTVDWRVCMSEAPLPDDTVDADEPEFEVRIGTPIVD
jgi:hypothetical protein